MKQISLFVLGFATAFAFTPARAQDFTAGKTPAQLFNSDCAECHRSPNGLARNRDVHLLANFLREHYTTKSETAGALAGYLSGFTGSGTAVTRNRGAGVAAPANIDSERPRAERRNRSEGETAVGDEARANPRPIEDQGVRHRRTTTLSGDNDKRRLRHDDEVPRPPGNVGTPPLRSNAAARNGGSRDATDPISRLRSYLSSGLSSEGTIAEAAKTGGPKDRKRRNREDNVRLPTPDVQATAKTTADEAPPALPSGTVDTSVSGAPPEGVVPPASAVSSEPAAVSPPRTEQ